MDQSVGEKLNVTPNIGVVGGASVNTGIVNNDAVNASSAAQPVDTNVDNSDIEPVAQNQDDGSIEENPFQALLDDSLSDSNDDLPEDPTVETQSMETVMPDENTEEISAETLDTQDYVEPDVSVNPELTEDTDNSELEDTDIVEDSREEYDDEKLAPYEKETIEAIAGCQQDAEILLRVASVPLDYESATPLESVASVLTEEYIKRRAQYPVREGASDSGDNDQMKAFDHLLSTLGFVREVSEDSPDTSETRIVINSSNTALTEGKASAIEAFKGNMDKLADDLEQEKNSLESQLANYREQCQREAEEREARIAAIQARFGL